VRIIRKRTLEEFWATYDDAEKPLRAWHQLTEAANWTSVVDVRKTFPTADAAGRLTVFNIKGNTYRLIVRIEYKSHMVYVRWFGTHADYDKNEWQKDAWF
jgi:mRNA interferase HigB